MMPLTFDDMLNFISNKEHFKFSRFGDGEWYAILRVLRRKWLGNSEGVLEAGKELAEILKSSPDYYIGLYDIALQLMGEHITEWSKKYELVWVSAHIIEQAFLKGKYEDFLKVISKVDNLFVIGPDYLDELSPETHIVTPSSSVWLSTDMIANEFEHLLEGDEVVLLACSYTANQLIHRFKDRDITMIDMGSTLDYYLGGIASRPYHKKLPGYE